METDNFSEFGGVAGRVLREAMGPGTWLTGFVLTLGVFICTFVLSRFGADAAAAVTFPLLAALALSRFALNGYAGEWRGTLFSSRGGGWVDVAVVAARYVVLSAVWFAPLLLLGWRPDQVGQALGTALMGVGETKMLSLTTLAGSAAALAPPLLLIGAVHAGRWSDLVSRTRWMRLFEDRLGDLFLIYVIYLGALGMAAALLLPVVTAALFQSTTAAAVFGLGALAFAFGLAVTLLGRLCGFFAAAGLDPAEVRTGPAGEPAAPIALVPPRANDASRMDPAPAGDKAAASEARPPSTPRPVPAPDAGPAADLHVVLGTAETKPDVKAPLLDAAARVDAVLQRGRSDPAGALAELQTIRAEHRPNPRVLHAVCMLQWRMGKRDASFETAVEALPHCMARGAVRPAAEIYALHLARAASFDLAPGQALEFADVLRTNRRFTHSEAVYRSLLDRDPDTGRIVKGLLQVADGYLHESVDYERARNLFRFLLDRCGDSPLAIHMREGLAEAERRLGQAS